MTTTLYTVGHSNHPLEEFVGLLRQHAVTTVVDVRSHPWSKWAPHFRKEPLARALAEVGIEYVFLGRALGGRPEDRDLYDPQGNVDYARRRQAPDFRAGIERLVALARDRVVAIACAEEDPHRCHRRLLLSPALTEQGVAVVHIRGDGRLEVEDGDQLRRYEPSITDA